MRRNTEASIVPTIDRTVDQTVCQTQLDLLSELAPSDLVINVSSPALRPFKKDFVQPEYE